MNSVFKLSLALLCIILTLSAAGCAGSSQIPLHTHSFVDGKCSCGQTSPDYAPHEHSYIDGNCSCGATDPSYAPHEHSYIDGVCSCGELDPDFSAAKITVLDKSHPESSVILYASGLSDEADTLKSLLASAGIKSIKATDTDNGGADYVIALGDTGSKASTKAKELYTQAKAVAESDFHWALVYSDGCLAVYADSDLGYEKAISALVSGYTDTGKLTVRENLAVTGVYTRAQYDAYLATLSAEEARMEQNAELLPSLLEKIEAQRSELDLLTGKVSKYDSSCAEILLFRSYTVDIGTPKWGYPPTSPSEEHPRLLLNAGTLPEIRKSLRADGAQAIAFRAFLESALPSDGILGNTYDHGSGNVHNLEYEYLEIIQAKALGYLAYCDPYYGYQAIYYMKNILKSLEIVKMANDQCRDYGYVMFTAAIVYDWCYALLTEEDKIQLIAGVENCLCQGENQAGSKTEVGFPPSGGRSVAGHACEYIILRDYLSFAIAIYGDNDSWWNYIGGRVYNDFLPMRNYYYQSGTTHQGTGTYITARFVGDLYSAWMLRTATGENPYVNMEAVLRSCLSYEFTPGVLLGDGDGGGDAVDGFRYMDIAYISAYLFGDSTVLAHADVLLGDNIISCEVHKRGYMGINSPLYMALTGLCDISPTEDRYENMELICYNGTPVGQYIVHSAWNSPETLVIYMRIKERSTANHEHADTGTFEIYYKGALTSDGGIYGSPGHPHCEYYHQATISHNGLIIYNPQKSAEDDGWYSGGQRNINNNSSNVNAWLNSTVMKTGQVTDMQYAYTEDGTAPLYAYIAGNITAAYDAETVSYVGRRMLSVFTGDEEFPMVFFVYDDITATDASYEKRFLLQISSPDAPVIDNGTKTVITENGDGRLVLTCLSDNVEINGRGGRNSGAYNATKSQNYLINGKQCVSNSRTHDDGHWGRVEIVYKGNAATSTFMNVIYVTDRGNENMASVVRTTSDKGMTGGVFNESVAALFATSRTRATSLLFCETHGSDSMTYYVSGVAMGSWQVNVNGKSVGIFEATKDGGLLTFEAPAGMVEISRVK